jgi:hypothetical protein
MDKLARRYNRIHVGCVESFVGNDIGQKNIRIGEYPDGKPRQYAENTTDQCTSEETSHHALPYRGE